MVEPLAVINMLRGFGVIEEPVSVGRLLRRAGRLVAEERVPGSVLDMAHMLAARELRKIIVTRDQGMECIAELLGVPVVRVGVHAALSPEARKLIEEEGSVEAAIEIVRRVREELSRELKSLLEQAEKAGERGCDAEADRVLDAFFDERIDYEEALERLKRLAKC